jgi:hypothetical protein
MGVVVSLDAMLYQLVCSNVSCGGKVMSICGSCGAEFGNDSSLLGFSTCPACRREKESLRQHEEMEARRQDEDERRHRERLDAEEERYQKQLEREEDRTFAEELRQSAEEDRYLQRKLDRENEREELLYKQRMQLANAWRYEAESKLQQAERLYQAGARREALTLAQQASVIGIDAWRLIGWIHRDDGEKGKYLEQLRVQIGVLDDCQNSVAHQERVLKEIFALADDGNDLLKILFDAATKWQIFPSSVIALLLERQDVKLANEVFTNASRKVPEDANNDVFVWTVCPFGVELSERGVQPHTWGKKFKEAIEKIPLSEVMTRNLKLILESTVMGAKTKALVRETMNAKGKHILASERVEMLKRLREDKESPDGLPWYLGPGVFAATIAGGFSYLLFKTGSGPLAYLIAAIPTYIAANSLRNWSNIRHFVQIKLANWYDMRRAIVGKALHLNDSTSLKVFGATSRPSHVHRLVKDVAVVIPALWLAHGLLGSIFTESKPVSLEMALDSFFGTEKVTASPELTQSLPVSEVGKWFVKLNILNHHIYGNGLSPGLIEAAKGKPLPLVAGSYIGDKVNLTVMTTKGAHIDGVLLYNGDCKLSTRENVRGYYSIKTCSGNWKTQSESINGVYTLEFKPRGDIFVADLSEGNVIKGIPDIKLIVEK